jgi:hypothetical protein
MEEEIGRDSGDERELELEEVPRKIRRRPTLYDTIRLARTVQEFTHRLRLRVEKRRSFAALSSRKSREGRHGERVYSALRRNCARPQSYYLKYLNRLEIEDADESAVRTKWSSFTSEVDKYAKFSNARWSEAACDDRCFVRNVPIVSRSIGLASGMTQLRRIRDYIEKLRIWIWWTRQQSLVPLLDETFIYNLQHLLDLYYGKLVKRIVNEYLRSDQIVSENYRRIRAECGDGWFHEWPNIRRPLSTTWPWNIKPSLVVLWGVCWMFYTPNPGQDGHARGGRGGGAPARTPPGGALQVVTTMAEAAARGAPIMNRSPNLSRSPNPRMQGKFNFPSNKSLARAKLIGWIFFSFQARQLIIQAGTA